MGIGRNRNSLYHLKSRPFSVGQKEEEKRVFHLEAVVLLYLPLELVPFRKREYRNLPVARKNKKSTGIEANHSDLKIGYLLELENVLRGRFLSREIADARTVSIPEVNRLASRN